MKDLFKKYEIELEEAELKKFEKFLEIFMEKNTLINLSAIREKDAIIEKHFVDSIMLNTFYDFSELKTQENKKIKVADMWTGWGFPLIPLAIINPEIDFIWIDSVAKKLKVIEEFALNLELKNISTLAWRAEIIWQNPKYRESFDLITSRATAFFPTLLEYTIPLLKVWWLFVAYKLDDKEELKSAKKALSRLSSKILKIKNYTIDWQKRTLVFIEKLHPTHKMFPRKDWIPLKNPIK